MKPVPPDRLRDVVDAVLEALDDGLDGPALAARAMLSPFHFNRLVRAGIGEAPATFRRRLLLERAAWRLGRGASVTDAALEAGYDAVEAFSRAFTRAHGVPPSRFADEPREFRLAAPNSIHFHPPSDHDHLYRRIHVGADLVLQLHAWDEEDHPNLVGPDRAPVGHGVLVWFEVDDYAAAAARARALGAHVIEETFNPRPQHHELWLRDPDGYVVVLASPDGSAAPTAA